MLTSKHGVLVSKCLPAKSGLRLREMHVGSLADDRLWLCTAALKSAACSCVALFMGTVPKRVRVSVYLMFWRVLACRMWASMVRVESVLCVVIIYSRYTRLVACRL